MNSTQPDSSSSDLPYYNKVPSEHVFQVLSFDKDRYLDQLKELIAWSGYNNAALYKPSTAPIGSHMCSFHPRGQNYEHNVNQILIGRPTTETITVSNTPGLTVRLPDRYVALLLAYSMDMYGLNPAMLLSLSTKESFYAAMFLDLDDGSYFLVDDDKAHFDCFAKPAEGLCSDANKDGPFQVETPAMSTDVSVFPQRFYIGSEVISKREPMMLTDNEILVTSTFRAFHDTYTLDTAKAVVLTSLDLHFRYNMMMKLQNLGLMNAYNARSDPDEKELLLFATAMYTYNRGIFDRVGLSKALNACTAGKDPISDCKLDGYGGHSGDIGHVCTLIERAPEVYDFPVSKADLEWFIAGLQGTYPFEKASLLAPAINWDQIRAAATNSFTLLAANRWHNESISYRYDWRAIVAVIRAYLPAKEYLLGDTLRSIFDIYGNSEAAAEGPLNAATAFPFEFVAPAGSHRFSTPMPTGSQSTPTSVFQNPAPGNPAPAIPDANPPQNPAPGNPAPAVPSGRNSGNGTTPPITTENPSTDPQSPGSADPKFELDNGADHARALWAAVGLLVASVLFPGVGFAL